MLHWIAGSTLTTARLAGNKKGIKKSDVYVIFILDVAKGLHLIYGVYAV